MPIDKTGQIVWHDLFTSDRKRSMDFFLQVAEWNFQTEHATDYAWGGGEKDFVLALAGGEAGAGFAETPPGMANGWIAYIEVPDVDAVAARAVTLGGVIVRSPFEVPGVGRNALLRDPAGALIGISLSRHDFPVPKRQFGVEIYASDATAFPEAFYAQTFNWKTTKPAAPGRMGDIINECTGDPVALHTPFETSGDGQALWVPNVKVADLEAAWHVAEARGAKLMTRFDTPTTKQHSSLIRDKDGAYSCLLSA